jgi:hypothetical protein
LGPEDEVVLEATGSSVEIARILERHVRRVVANAGMCARSRMRGSSPTGLTPTSRQSGEKPARGGRISKRGNTQARPVLVEAAWTATRSPGPLRAFGERVRARRGAHKAAVAVARKLTVLSWNLQIERVRARQRGAHQKSPPRATPRDRLSQPPRPALLLVSHPRHHRSSYTPKRPPGTMLPKPARRPERHRHPGLQSPHRLEHIQGCSHPTD